MDNLDVKSEASSNSAQLLDNELNSMSGALPEASDENIQVSEPESEKDDLSEIDKMFSDDEEGDVIPINRPGLTKVEKSAPSKPGKTSTPAKDSPSGSVEDRLKQLAAKHGIPNSVEELAKGFMRTADYTKKTQELKSQREKVQKEYEDMKAYGDKVTPLVNQAVNFQNFLDTNEDVRGLIIDVLDWKKENPDKPLVDFTKFYLPTESGKKSEGTDTPKAEKKVSSDVPSIISGKPEKSEKLDQKDRFVLEGMVEKEMNRMRKDSEWDFPEEVAEEIQRITHKYGFSTFEPALEMMKAKTWEDAFNSGRVVLAGNGKKEEKPKEDSDDLETKMLSILEKKGVLSRTKENESSASHSGKQSGSPASVLQRPRSMEEAHERMRKELSRADSIKF